MLEVYQTQEKRELRHPFAFYSASNIGWLCHLCSKYGEGDEYRRSFGVKLHEHPTETFKRQMESKKHTDAKRENTRNQKSIKQRKYMEANDQRRKTTIQKCHKEKPPHNKEIS